MFTTAITELPYYQDSCIYFEQIRDLPHPIFLDSCHPYSDKGRYDIISACPDTYLTNTHTDPFLSLKTLLSKYPARKSFLPFNGGALGYFTYDLNQELETLPQLAIRDITLPTLGIGIYLWAVVTDHQLKKTYLLPPPTDYIPTQWDMIQHRLHHLQKIKDTHFYFQDSLQSNLTKAEYQKKFADIMTHLQQGDVYQLNFAQRWQASVEGDPWHLYRLLRQHNPAPFAAFLPLEDGAIISCSPERFLTIDNGIVSTMPIKGTIARLADPKEDMLAAQALMNSAKNRAENVMIVDLMRNDLGKSCVIGSVKVPEFCALHSFANVHHLVSTVTGQLREDTHSVDILRDCFPGGSITGAPKIRAMELIEQYETYHRHIYCGSIGYIDCNGKMDTNIAIRTAVICRDQFYIWGGGGIVIDSDPSQEYQETIDKVRPFLALSDCLIL